MLVAAYVPAEGWDHMSGWGWSWMALAWISVIALVVWAVSRSRAGSRHHGGAEVILAERFARGEITAEQFEERRAILKGR